MRAFADLHENLREIITNSHDTIFKSIYDYGIFGFENKSMVKNEISIMSHSGTGEYIPTKLYNRWLFLLNEVNSKKIIPQKTVDLYSYEKN